MESLHDVENGTRHLPLGALVRGDSRFIICNSMLSEAAVLGFEYGYSTAWRWPKVPRSAS